MNDTTRPDSSRQPNPPSNWTVTVGLGLKNPHGKDRQLDGAAPVDDLARLLVQHRGEEAWLAPAKYDGAHRKGEFWLSSGVVVIDIDYHAPTGRHGAKHGVTMPDALRERLEALIRSGASGASIAYLTPCGARLIYVMGEVQTDGGLWRGVASRIGDHVTEILRRNELHARHGVLCEEDGKPVINEHGRKTGAWVDGLVVDTGALTDIAHMFWTPNATVDGEARSAEVFMLRQVPIDPADLAPATGPAPNKTGAPLLERILDALAAMPDAKRNGRGVEIRCPYHDDHDPSAIVFADEGNLHCKACDQTWLLRDWATSPEGRGLIGDALADGVMAQTSADQGSKRRGGLATRLVQLACHEAELIRGTDGDAYASVRVEGHLETYAIRSGSMRAWLRVLCLDLEGRVPGEETISSAVRTLEAYALRDGEERPVALRLGEHAGDVYLDLGRHDVSVVRVTSSGWSVEPEPAIRFVRRGKMAEIPVPVSGGALDMLRSHVRVREEDWSLLVAWMLSALTPRGPYPILIIEGEQGTGKTTAARMIKGLVDPAARPDGLPATTDGILSPPRSEDDLVITARHRRVLAFDNLSTISEWLSDALCRLATGGGIAKRELFTDGEEFQLSVTRPVILTAIERVATRGDLADRALTITLEPIPDAERRTEAEMWAAYERDRPQILGALLDALSCALRRVADVRRTMRGAPRMADLTAWVTAAEPALGWPDGTFVASYAAHRAGASDVALEGDPVAVAIRRLDLPFENTATELLKALSTVADTDQKAWPRTARKLSGWLRRWAPDLRRSGIDVRMPTAPTGHERKRIITIERMEICASDRSHRSHGSHSPHDARESGTYEDPRNDRSEASTDRDAAAADHPEVPTDRSDDPIDRETDRAFDEPPAEFFREDTATRERCDPCDRSSAADRGSATIVQYPDDGIIGNEYEHDRGDRVRTLLEEIGDQFPGAVHQPSRFAVEEDAS